MMPKSVKRFSDTSCVEIIKAHDAEKYERFSDNIMRES